MRDSQRQKVYDWQNNLFNAVAEQMPDIFVELPIDVATRFATKICLAYGVQAPNVKYHRQGNGAKAFYTGRNHTITLPGEWACCPKTVAHEAAHAVTHHLFGFGVAGHGKEFVRVYANIMTSFLDIEPSLVERSIKASRIQCLETLSTPINLTNP